MDSSFSAAGSYSQSNSLASQQFTPLNADPRSGGNPQALSQLPASSSPQPLAAQSQNPNNSSSTQQQQAPPSGTPGPAVSATPLQGASAGVAIATTTPVPQLCDTSVSPLYCVYTIQPNETLSDIARKFGLRGNPAEGVMSYDIIVQSNKPEVTGANDVLQIGQKLRIPKENAVLHTVLTAETLSDIAETYDVSSRDISAVALNGIGNADQLTIGQELLVPSPKRMSLPTPTPTATPTPEPTATPTPRPATATPAVAASSGGSGSNASAPEAPAAPPPAAAPATTRSVATSGAGFIWPASGPISSYFGPAHPLGIDIDFYSNPNQSVGAAAGGTVTFAGGNACCSYGYYVVVDHGNGYSTLYAHLSTISVSVGQRVSQGQQLGLGGRTGYATGNHLHFEVKRNGVVVNPVSVLP